MHWIKAEIHEYILKNWRMVKVATTKAQRKLFFNLRSMKQSLKEDASDEDTHRSTMTQGEVDTLARTLNVKREEVLEMETRLSGGDVALEPQSDESDEGSFAPIAYPADDANEPTRVMEAKNRDWLAGDGIAMALDTLDCTQPPHRRGALAEGQRRQLGRHDLARPGRRVRRQCRTDSPDRGVGDEEDAQGAGGKRLTATAHRRLDSKRPCGAVFHGLAGLQQRPSGRQRAPARRCHSGRRAGPWRRGRARTRPRCGRSCSCPGLARDLGVEDLEFLRGRGGLVRAFRAAR
jgi:hypothetical protein